MIEKEYKALITQKQYEYIKLMFEWKKCIMQKNYYFDTDEMYCSQNDITVRIRQKKEGYYLQVKTPICCEGGLHIKKEYKKKLHHLKDVITSNDFNELSVPVHIPDVKQIGNLITERLEFNINGTTLCLDKSKYNNIVDYEVEIEYSGEYVDAKLLEQVMSAGVKFNVKTEGKYTRFCKTLEKGVLSDG